MGVAPILVLNDLFTLKSHQPSYFISGEIPTEKQSHMSFVKARLNPLQYICLKKSLPK